MLYAYCQSYTIQSVLMAASLVFRTAVFRQTIENLVCKIMHFTNLLLKYEVKSIMAPANGSLSKRSTY